MGTARSVVTHHGGTSDSVAMTPVLRLTTTWSTIGWPTLASTTAHHFQPNSWPTWRSMHKYCPPYSAQTGRGLRWGAHATPATLSASCLPPATAAASDATSPASTLRPTTSSTTSTTAAPMSRTSHHCANPATGTCTNTTGQSTHLPTGGHASAHPHNTPVGTRAQLRPRPAANSWAPRKGRPKWLDCVSMFDL